MKVEIISIKPISRWKFWKRKYANKEVTVKINGEERTVDVRLSHYITTFINICRIKARLLGIDNYNYSLHHEYRLFKKWFNEVKNLEGLVFEI